MRRSHRLGLVAWLPVAVACSATGSSSLSSTAANGTGGGASTTDSTGVGGTDFTGSGGSTSSGSSEGCAEAATFVYVLSTDNDMYRFEPDTKVLTLVGHLSCPTSMQPNSMAVDRNATAWVNYVSSDGLSDNGGALFPVSTTDASCMGAGIPLPAGWYRLGMGFSSDGVDSTSETLYITGSSSNVGLGRFDFATKKVKPIAPFGSPLDGESAELTGTGDGRLYGFFTTSPTQVAQLGKEDGEILWKKYLTPIPKPLAWAFSFWGGDFYLYTSDGFSNSRVSRYRPADQSIVTDYLPNAGFTIVGAGVSTCAPVESPK